MLQGSARAIYKTRDHRIALLSYIYITADKTLDPMIVNNISIIPDPPEKGKKLTVTVYFNLSEWYTHTHTRTHAHTHILHGW